MKVSYALHNSYGNIIMLNEPSRNYLLIAVTTGFSALSDPDVRDSVTGDGLVRTGSC